MLQGDVAADRPTGVRGARLLLLHQRHIHFHLLHLSVQVVTVI
jgi:hypothetical protein